jgi:hypothetical protein
MHYEYGHTRNCWAQHNRTSYSRGTSRIDLVFLLKISNFSLKIHLWGSKWGSKGGKRLWKCTWSGTRIKNLERFYTSAWESNDICQGTEWFFDWFWIWKKFVNIDADCITQHNWLVRFQIWQIVSGLFGSCSCLIDWFRAWKFFLHQHVLFAVHVLCFLAFHESKSMRRNMKTNFDTCWQKSF